MNRIAVSHFWIRSKRPGPTVVITAGIHGTEVAGVFAARDLRQTLFLQRGQVLVLPLINPVAYRLRVRGVPDQNRQFPKHRNDSCKTNRAREVFRLIRHAQPSWCIDLHEANGLSRVHKQSLGQTVLVYPHRAAKATVTKAIAQVNRYITPSTHRFLMRVNTLPGSLRTACGLMVGAHAITIETSMRLRLAQRVTMQKDIVYAVLRQLSMI